MLIENLFYLLPFFLIAALYASVGHGGASGYIAILIILSAETSILRPTALSLNILVSFIGTLIFFREGFFNLKFFLPLSLAAIPFAYLGGSLAIDESLFRKILALTLIFSSFRLFLVPRNQKLKAPPSRIILCLSGIVLGFISGLLGVGGGIFLTPMIIIFGWGTPKMAAALSAPFILLNSISGLIGLRPSLAELHPLLIYLALVVLFGGYIGSRWGARIASEAIIRSVLACVLIIASFKLFLY